MTRMTVCEIDELRDGAARGFEVPGGMYDGFVVRVGDRVHAYLNTCPHHGHPLNWKPDAFLTRSGESIMCSVHGAVFEKRDGLCIAGPCVGKSLRPMECAVEDGFIVVRC